MPAVDKNVLSAIRTLTACEHAAYVIRERPTAYPYRPSTIPAATKRRKLAKLASDMATALDTLVPSVS